jgi:hypothetical protein
MLPETTLPLWMHWEHYIGLFASANPHIYAILLTLIVGVIAVMVKRSKTKADDAVWEMLRKRLPDGTLPPLGPDDKPDAGFMRLGLVFCMLLALLFPMLVGCAGKGGMKYDGVLADVQIDGEDKQNVQTNYGRYAAAVKYAIKYSQPGKTTINGLGALVAILKKDNITKADIEAASEALTIETTQEMRFDLADIEREPTGHELWAGVARDILPTAIFGGTVLGVARAGFKAVERTAGHNGDHFITEGNIEKVGGDKTVTTTSTEYFDEAVQEGN